MGYLIVVNYDKDVERKRVDYLIEKWSNRGNIEKIRKMAIITDMEDMDEFVKDIMSRLEGNPEKKVRIYKIEEVKKTVPSKKATLNYKLTGRKGAEAVTGFLKYLMVKIGASYVCSIGTTKKYEAYTKKGSCFILIKLQGKTEMDNWNENTKKNKKNKKNEMIKRAYENEETKKNEKEKEHEKNEKNEHEYIVITFEIEGYGESVDLIKNKIDNDMKLFIEGVL
jgi:hypothetical protein